MTKADLVNEISVRTGISREDTVTVIEHMMLEVKKSLRKGENIYLRGFGTFLVKTRKEKTGRNISQNTAITIPEHKIASFRPAKNFIYDEENSYMNGVSK